MYRLTTLSIYRRMTTMTITVIFQLRLDLRSVARALSSRARLLFKIEYQIWHHAIRKFLDPP